jgi:hypothetical protein
MSKAKWLLFILCNSFIFLQSNAQDSLKVSKVKMPIFSFKNGLGITTPDSLFSLNFRFRIQSRVGYISKSDKDLTPEEFDFRVRRIRLRIGGFIYTPRLTYNVQLSFSRADMDWDVSQVPNVLRDAMIAYEIPQGFTFAIGQGKLPGNRQRVISSGELQFADRSIVNNALTLDRDFGVFVNYANHYKQFHFILKTAISSGEGRNILKSDKGLAYTARFEMLPLGTFTDRGDYFEGDLLHEPKPKLAFAATAHYNHLAARTQGQLGTYLYAPRSLFSVMADGVFKYKGWALSSEYLYRSTDSALTVNKEGAVRYVYAGMGSNTQFSYCFKKMFEIAVRYSILLPNKQIYDREKQKSQYAICLSKYIMKHKLKVQTDFTYERQYDLSKKQNYHNDFQWRFQVELGI